MYKNSVLLEILAVLHPGVPIACHTTYGSIVMQDIGESIPCLMDDAFKQRLKNHTSTRLVPEEAIQEKYPEFTLLHNLRILRMERSKRLVESDVFGLADCPFYSDDIKKSWLDYRQALRDITSTYTIPVTDANDNLVGVVWPSKPVSG